MLWQRSGRPSIGKSGSAMAAYTDLVLFRRVLRHTRAYWLHILALFTLTWLTPPSAPLTPRPLKLAANSLSGSPPPPRPLEMWLPPAVTGSPTALLIFVVGLLVAITLLGQAQGLASALLGNYVKEKMILDFRTYMFRHLQRISLSYHDSKGTADSVYRIQHDVPDIQQVVTESAIPFVSSSITLVGMIYVMGRIDWQLALIAIAIWPPLIVIARLFRRRLRRQSRETKKLDSSALAIVQEVLGALRIVKAFGQQAREERRYLRRGGEVMRARLRQAFMEGEFNVFVGLTTAAGTAAVLFIGLSHVRANALTLGQLLMVMGYLNQLYAPLKTISRKAASLQANLVAAERAFAVLDQPPDVVERPDARPLTRAAGAIAFRDVSFAYSPDRRVLHDISFTIEPGSRPGGQRARVHHSIPPGLPDPGGRAWGPALRRAAPAHRHRPRVLERQPGAHPGRADQRRRSGGGGGDRRRDPAADARPHRHLDHTPAATARALHRPDRAGARTACVEHDTLSRRGRNSGCAHPGRRTAGGCPA